MKSKYYYTLTCFILYLISSSQALSTGFNALSEADQNKYTKIWTDLFNKPQAKACSKRNLKANIKRELVEEEVIVPPGKGAFYWVKHWGYGAASYLFDFLDPILQKPVVAEFSALHKDLMSVPNTDANIPDPYDYKKLITMNKQTLTKKQLKRLKLFTKHFDEKIYSQSANLPQLKNALQKWKWPVNYDDLSFFKHLVLKYDMNFDGRLNPREVILMSLYNNPQIVGSKFCDNCYKKISQTLDAMFLYLDCNNDGFLSAEELWSNLPQVKRGTPKWNIFSFGNDHSIRTASVNDFIIKNMKQREGYLTRTEFRVGVLLGFWDRQTKKGKVVEDDTRSLKKLRWKDGDMTDVAMYLYQKRKKAARHTAKVAGAAITTDTANRTPN